MDPVLKLRANELLGIGVYLQYYAGLFVSASDLTGVPAQRLKIPTLIAQ
jgi:hypothetical protein